MDWLAIATVLGERVDRPLMILDSRGRIRLFNHAMERVLGFCRFDVEGQTWAQACAPGDFQKEARRWMDAALTGTLRMHDVPARTKSGALVTLHVEFALVGRGRDQVLLATVVQSVQLPSFRGPSPGRDLDYEIRATSPRFGEICRLSIDGEVVPTAEAGARCYHALYGRDGPCAGCPVLETKLAWPRSRVRPSERTGAGFTFEITSAVKIDEELVRVRTRTLSEAVITMIQDAKVQIAAEGANLSAREREVLRYLLLGRSIDDIAQLTGIAVRTVKHHQANLLAKLGADSRADLIRVLY